MIAIDYFLAVPKILAAPAFKEVGMLIIGFDEGTTATSCCNKRTGPNTVAPAGLDRRGVRIGALIISPFVKLANWSAAES